MFGQCHSFASAQGVDASRGLRRRRIERKGTVGTARALCRQLETTSACRDSADKPFVRGFTFSGRSVGNEKDVLVLGGLMLAGLAFGWDMTSDPTDGVCVVEDGAGGIEADIPQ